MRRRGHNPPDPLADLIVSHKSHRWFVWRDIVTLLLAIAVVMLVRQVGNLRTQLEDATNARSRQIAALTAQLDDLQAQLDSSQATITAKDARIRQLTDALIKAKQPVPAVSASAAVDPQPQPQPQPSGPRPSPAPRPSPTPTPTSTSTPSPTPTSSPSPTPSGLLCRLNLTC